MAVGTGTGSYCVNSSNPCVAAGTCSQPVDGTGQGTPGTGTGTGGGTGTGTGSPGSGPVSGTGTDGDPPLFPDDYASGVPSSDIGGVGIKLDRLHNDLTEETLAGDPFISGAYMPGVGITFDGILGWTLPTHTSTCPQPQIDLSGVLGAGRVFTLSTHCQIAEEHFPVLQAAMMAVWTIAATLNVAVGGLDVLLSLLDQDSRFKTISRPMVRVRSGAQARFSVGQDVPVLGQATLDKNGNPVQAVEYKQSGVILTVTPDIRESVVDLDISQELSSFVATTTGVNGSPTLLKRTVNSKLSIKPGEVVIFAGLNEKKTDETESRFFGFSLGNKINQGDSEILVFVEAQRI